MFNAENVLRAVAVEAINLVGCQGGLVALKVPAGFVCHQYFQKSGPVAFEHSLRPGRQPPLFVNLDHASQLPEAFLKDHVLDEFRKCFCIGSALGAPIFGPDGDLKAFIDLHDKEGAAGFTGSDQRTLTALCRVVSVGLQNAVEFEKLCDAFKEREKHLTELSGRLLRAQTEESRNWGKTLHDTVGQFLTALQMYLGVLDKSAGRLKPQARAALEQCHRLVEERFVDVRSRSYLLHPPMLERAGLVETLAWYAQGFAQRSGIRVILQISPDFPRLPADLENALFSVIQEALTNIYRHSGSPTAKIIVAREAHDLKLEISDAGKGLPPTVSSDLLGPGLGVGLACMRERVRQFDCSFDLQSGNTGTSIKIGIPLVPRVESNVTEDSGRR